MSSNFDLASLALKAAFPNNSIIVDDKGLPSVMVKIPKFKMSDVITGGSSSTHPAFIVDGVEKDYIYISKYQNKVYNGRAYSLPGEDPTASLNADTAMGYCTAKGTGWHLMTAAEWAALALWCKANGWMPYGNNDYGKDTRETMYKAVPSMALDSNNRIQRVATGTGPVEWSHNKQLDGIYDLNGNVWEWVGGLRLVYGELQILENNNAANSSNSQGASSAQWKAIDGTDGTLITPDGSGTTANSVKLEWTGSVWKWQTAALTEANKGSHGNTFVSVAADAGLHANVLERLYALGMMPDDTSFDYEGDYLYADTSQAERFPLRGGGWNSGTKAGVFGTYLLLARSAVSADIGFRSAFYE